MKFMDRLSRFLGRLPDSLKTAADRPQHQSEHTATSSIEIVAADDGSSGQKGAEGLGDRNFVHPQPPDLISPHVAPHSEKTVSSGGASSIDLGHTVSAASQCHSIVTNNPPSAANPRASRASNEAKVEMSERLSWQETEHDTSEFIADLAPSIVDADTTAGATSDNDERTEADYTEPAHCEQQPGAVEQTRVALVKIECPGCRAIYEVGGELIPPDGRDMQCSNCGHEWFHPSDTSTGIDPPQTSPSAPEQPRVHHLASPDGCKPGVAGAIAPIVRADCLPLSPSEVRLVISGQPEALRDFIASGRLHAVDPKGDSPLHLAARMGKLALCDVLVRAGADPDALNHGRQTSADVALAEGHTLVAQLLYSLSAKSGRTEGIEGQTIGPLPDRARQTASPTHLLDTNAIEARAHEDRDQSEPAQSAATTWTTERVVLLRKLWSEGRSANQISRELGNTSRNAVLSKLFRLGLLNKPREAIVLPTGDSIPQPHGPQPTLETSDPDIEQLRAEPLLDGRCDDFEDSSRAALAAEAVAHSNAKVEEPKTGEQQPAIRAELDSLDDLLQFEAEEEPEAYFGQSVGTKASGTFVALVSSAPSVPDQEDGDWNLDLSPAQIAGDGIGSTGLSSPDKGDEHGFLKVRNRGRKSTKKAVIQTGTQLTIDADFCLAWAKEVLAKGWCSGGDLDQLIDSCEGNGDPDELRINLERNLEVVGLTGLLPVSWTAG